MKKYTRGFTLVELMISVGLLALVFLAIALYMVQTAKNSEQIRITAARDELANQISKTISNPRALMNSRWVPGAGGTPASAVIGNRRLLECLAETYRTGSLCLSGQSYPFVLYDDSILAATAANQPIGGDSNATPVRYTRDGAPCNPRMGALPAPAWLCPFEVVTSFQPFCKGQLPPAPPPSPPPTSPASPAPPSPPPSGGPPAPPTPPTPAPPTPPGPPPPLPPAPPGSPPPPATPPFTIFCTPPLC